MRMPADKRGRSRKASSKTLPAPTLGWNCLDSIADMPPSYAPIMQNFIPTSSTVDIREGSEDWATGAVGEVETLAVYNNGTVNEMFAAVGGGIYDVTASGAVGAPLVTGQISNRWQQVNFATSGGRYLVMANGADDMQLYDGTTWMALNSLSTPAITGVATSNIINLAVFQNKLWLIENNELVVWYLPSASIGGLAIKFDLSSLFSKGGYLVAMGDWTIDSGEGVDDLAVFITSEGQVAVYRGTDPSSASTWALEGIYEIGSPIGRRCLAKFASDLTIINQDGFQLMSSALSSSRVSLQSSITDKIQPAIKQAIRTYGVNFGWETTLFSARDVIFVNIPITGMSHQYMMNTKTKGWCDVSGWDANCFSVMKDELYYGTTNKVVKAFVGTSDNGNQINGNVLQAFSNMGSANLKQFVMAKPILQTDSNSIGVLLGLNVDYDLSAPTGSPTFTAGTSGLWDVALWDDGLWGGEISIKKDWQTVGSVGNAGAIYLKTASTNSKIQWAATTFFYNSATSYF